MVRTSWAPRRRGALATLVCMGLMAIGLIFGVATPAHACSCTQVDLKSLAKSGDAVFVGTPVQKETSGGTTTYTVRVSDVYRGSADPTTTVETDADPASCGVDLELDTQYMFIGEQQRPHGTVTTTTCSGTQQVSDRVIAAVEQTIGPATPYRGAPDAGPDGNGGNDGKAGSAGDSGDSGDSTGDSGNEPGSGAADAPGGTLGGDADSDQQSTASDGGGDDEMSTGSIVIGMLILAAIGGSFLLPRLRRRNRAR